MPPGDPKNKIIALIGAFALFNIVTQTVNPYSFRNQSTRSSSGPNK